MELLRATNEALGFQLVTGKVAGRDSLGFNANADLTPHSLDDGLDSLSDCR